jgi:hypothetical protein
MTLLPLQIHLRIPAARCVRVLRGRALERMEGAGNAGCALHPRSRVQKCAKNAHEHTGSAEAIRHSLRNGFTAYAALSPATNSSCHRHRRINSFAEPGWACENLRRLDTSNGCQDHTVLPYATASFVCMKDDRSRETRPAIPFHADAAASTATRPNVRDDGQRPSLRDRMARACRDDLPDKQSGIFFARGLDRKI